MRIVIPTYGRAHKQVTLAALPPELQEDAILVTSDPAEAAVLKRAWRAKGVVVKDAPVATIAQKRQWILENIRDDVFMLDDDMVFYARCPMRYRDFVNGRWKAREGHKTLSLDYVAPHLVAGLFRTLSDELDGNYPLVGISSRFGNDLEPLDFKGGANRLMHAFGYNRKELRARCKGFRFDAVPFREDFHMALSVYRTGAGSAQSYDWCVAPGAYGAPGGCSAERTVAASNAAAHQLAELHPGFVKVVQKDYKGTPREEVVVSWQKALKEGMKNA